MPQGRAEARRSGDRCHSPRPEASRRAAKAELSQENLDALEKGLPNLLKHIENITVKFGLPAVVAVNRFPPIPKRNWRWFAANAREYGANVALSEVWGKGGEGGLELAEEVLRLTEQPNDFHMIYPDEATLREKVEAVAREIYQRRRGGFLPAAAKELDKLTALGYGNLPVCIAKTQYSLSDNPALLGWPEGPASRSKTSGFPPARASWWY